MCVTPTAFSQSEPATLGFTLSPSSGPPGTRVQFEGDVPVDSADFSTYQDPQFAYGLDALDVATNPPGCNLIVEIEQVSKTVTATGHITGSFVVGHQGGCFMSDTDRGPQPARPGVYEVLLGCHGCTAAGTFTITSASLARTGVHVHPPAIIGALLVVLGLTLETLLRRLKRADPR